MESFRAPALKFLVSLLPFMLKGMNTDGGGEFINITVAARCRLLHMAFSRNRPYHNDNPYVEQKNTAVGSMRYDTPEELRLLNQIHSPPAPAARFLAFDEAPGADRCEHASTVLTSNRKVRGMGEISVTKSWQPPSSIGYRTKGIRLSSTNG